MLNNKNKEYEKIRKELMSRMRSISDSQSMPKVQVNKKPETQKTPDIQQAPSVQKTPETQQIPSVQQAPETQQMPWAQPGAQQVPKVQQAAETQQIPKIQQKPNLQQIPEIQPTPEVKQNNLRNVEQSQNKSDVIFNSDSFMPIVDANPKPIKSNKEPLDPNNLMRNNNQAAPVTNTQNTVQNIPNVNRQNAPMAGRTSVVDNLASATHSVETVKYKPKPKRTNGRTILMLFVMVAIIFTLSWLLREFVFQAYEIPSGSMEKTIMTGDMVFAEKISHNFGSPKAGDIITFTDPLDPNRVLIKRVIATEGQTVDITDKGLLIDGKSHEEWYTNNLPTKKLGSSKVTYPYKVPDGCVWVMGDNRTNSQDSRYFGAIPEDSIIGRGLFVYWPLNDAKFLE